MTGPRNRRTLLRTGALAVTGLSGCVGGLGDDTEDPTTAETRTTTRTTATPESPLEVEDVRVQSSFVHRTTPDSATVAAPEETQFVFADVRSTESSAPLPAAEAVALVADDRWFAGTTTPGSTHSSSQLYEQESTYDPDDRGPGWVAFEVPVPLDAEEVALIYDSGSRTVSEGIDAEVVETLAEPPAEFELVAVDAPELIPEGRSFEISVTVENASETDGVFRAIVNQTHPIYQFRTFEMTVPAGERREWTDAFGRYLDRSNADSASYQLVSPVGERGMTVEVVSETTDEA